MRSWRSRMSRKTDSPDCQSRLPVGSSARRRLGSLTRARAMATLCCSPPESWPGRWPALSSSETSVERLAGPGERLSPVQAPDHEREADVLQGRELGQEMVELEDEADLPVPEGGHLAGRLGEEVLAVEDDPPFRRPVQAAEEVEEGRLADARGPHDRGQVPPAELEVEALEDAQDPLREGIGFPQVLGGQDDVTHISAPRPGRPSRPAGPGRASRRG